MEILTIDSIENIYETSRQFIDQIGNNRIFAFYGKMGAGKTTFIKSICEELGIKETVNSPTFSIINEYETAEGKIIYHFDFYRINKIQEALDFGTEEYFYSDNLCFIEWPENVASLLPDSVVSIEIIELENGKRQIKIK